MGLFGPSKQDIKEAIINAHYEIENAKARPHKRDRYEEVWIEEKPQCFSIFPKQELAMFIDDSKPPESETVERLIVPVIRKATWKYRDWLERKDGELTGRILYSECLGEKC